MHAAEQQGTCLISCVSRKAHKNRGAAWLQERGSMGLCHLLERLDVDVVFLPLLLQDDKAAMLRTLHSLLIPAGMLKVVMVPSALVPVCKFECPSTHIRFNVSINNMTAVSKRYAFTLHGS